MPRPADMLRRLGMSLSTSFWRRVDPALREALPKRSPLGRPRCPPRVVVCAIVYRLRTGCQWRALPRVFGPPSTVHGWFQKLNNSGIWRDLWCQTSALLTHPDPLLLDASIIKSPLGGDLTGPSPVHRSRLGFKRSLLTDAKGIPYAAFVLIEADVEWPVAKCIGLEPSRLLLAVASILRATVIHSPSVIL